MKHLIDYRAFDALVNPDNLKVYHIKQQLKYSDHDPVLYTLDELIVEYDKDPTKSISIMLNLLDLIFVDVDNAEANGILKGWLEGTNYVEISSYREGCCHIIMRRGTKTVPIMVQGVVGLNLHDWYRMCSTSPFMPNLPNDFEDSRKFVSIPETLDVIPEELFDAY